jgi:hypothetical protein
MSGTQVKPCPFCGGPYSLRRNPSGGSLVKCEELGCSFTQEIPLAQWNARPEMRDASYDASFDRAALRSRTEHETANAIADWLAACGMPGTSDAVREGRYRPMEPHNSPDLQASHDKIGARLDNLSDYVKSLLPTRWLQELEQSSVGAVSRPDSAKVVSRLDLIIGRLDSIVTGLADVKQQISNIGR